LAYITIAFFYIIKIDVKNANLKLKHEYIVKLMHFGAYAKSEIEIR